MGKKYRVGCKGLDETGKGKIVFTLYEKNRQQYGLSLLS